MDVTIEHLGGKQGLKFKLIQLGVGGNWKDHFHGQALWTAENEGGSVGGAQILCKGFVV